MHESPDVLKGCLTCRTAHGGLSTLVMRVYRARERGGRFVGARPPSDGGPRFASPTTCHSGFPGGPSLRQARHALLFCARNIAPKPFKCEECKGYVCPDCTRARCRVCGSAPYPTPRATRIATPVLPLGTSLVPVSEYLTNLAKSLSPRVFVA